MEKTTKQTAKTVKPVAFKMLDGAKAIDTAIKSIASRGKTLEKDIHQAAVSCLVHADKHGDITLASKLVDAVPSLARKNALRDWFIAHGKFSWSMEAKAFTFNKQAVTQLEAAIATPFWEFKTEAEYKPFNMEAAVLQLVKRAESAIEKGEKVPTEKLAQLRKLAA